MPIVPTNRLLLWAALVLPSAALLMTVEPKATAALSAILVLGLIMAAADSFSARKSLSAINVEIPRVIRSSRNRPTEIRARVQNTRTTGATVRVGLRMPEGVGCEREDLRLQLGRGVEWSQGNWKLVPRRRGRFVFSHVAVEAESQLGLWNARKLAPVQSELRVYPNLFQEKQTLAGVVLRRGLGGIHTQRQLGKGREFEKLREYVPGDGYDEIHWKATARRGAPITKVFQVERTQEIYVVIDASRLSARRADSTEAEETTTLERYVTAALVLAQAAEQQGDLFGVTIFSNKVEKFLRAANGKAHYGACRDALYMLQPSDVSPDYDEVTTFLRSRVRRRALLVFLTALDDPVLAESFTKNAQLLRRNNLVLASMIQPPGISPLFSGAPPEDIDSAYRQLGGHLLWHDLKRLQQSLHNQGIRLALVPNERLCPDVVEQYLRVKQRQAL